MRMSDIRFLGLCAFAAALVGLAACGGGGGGGGSAAVTFPALRTGTASPGADITAQNADALSADVVRSVLAANRGGAAVPVAGAGPGAVARVVALRAFAAARREMPQAVQPLGPDDLPDCFGGQVSGSVNDADNNNRPTAGDSVTLVFNGCVLAPGTPGVSGSATTRFDQIELEAGDELRAAALTMTLTNLGAAGQPVINGTVNLWVRVEASGDVHLLLRFNQVTAQMGGATHVIDWDMDIRISASTLDGAVTLSGQVSVGGQRYAVAQRVAFGASSSQGYPTQGTLRVSDAAGDRVDITATVQGVGRTFGTSAGVETPLPTQPWSAFGG